MPEYYDPAKVALFWGISPERVIELPVYWVEAAIVISRAEAAAAEKLDRLRQMQADVTHGPR